MSYSRAFGSCHQVHAPVRFDSIAATCKSFILMGDLCYTDGTSPAGGTFGTVLYNGDVFNSMQWTSSVTTQVILTVGAATTINGVAGQLPLGACTVTNGGGGYPASQTISVQLQQTSNGVQGGAIALLTTSAGGVVTAASIVAGGKGYTNGGAVAFGTYNEPWSVGYHLRRARQTLLVPSWQDVVAAKTDSSKMLSELIYIPDDHDHGGNNWDYDNTGLNVSGVTSQVKVLDMYRTVKLGLRSIVATYFDNAPGAPNGDIPAGLVGITGAAGIVTGADFDVRYFSRYADQDGRVIGKDSAAGVPVVCEIFLDCITYKSFQSAADNAGKTMLGATQKAWLKATMVKAKADGAQAIWIFSGKDLFNLDNKDGWGATAGGGTFPYITERDEILLYIQANNLPVAGWMTGDRHAAHAALTTLAQPASTGVVYESLSVCATPFGSPQGVTIAFDMGSTPYPEEFWQHMGRDQLVYGTLTWNSALNQSEFRVLDNADDIEQLFVAVSAGARIPRPDQIRMLRPN